MVIERAGEAGGFWAELFLESARVAGGHGFGRAKLNVRGDRHEGELGHLEEGGEGEGREFGGHFITLKT